MPPYRNYIYEYHAKITSGEIIAGKWIKKIYEIIINGLQKQEYFFNAKAANKAIRFIENFCHHSKGRNDLIKLELWQKAIVSVIFGIQDAEKIRIFREIFIVIGRKNGKSLFASAIIAYMAYLEPEYGQEIYCLAPKLDQAALVYDGFYQMVQAEDELAELAKKRRSDIYIAESNTVIKPIAFNAKKSDGFNPQLVVCDEMAAWSGDAGLKQYEVTEIAGVYDSYVSKTEGLFAQYESQFNERYSSFESTLNNWDNELLSAYTDFMAKIKLFQSDAENEFNTWFESIKDKLGEDIAGSLQLQIEELAAAMQEVKKQAEAGTKETKEAIAALDERLKRVESGWGIDYKHDAVLGLCYMGAAYMSQHYERTVETAVLGATYVGNSYLANTF